MILRKGVSYRLVYSWFTPHGWEKRSANAQVIAPFNDGYLFVIRDDGRNRECIGVKKEHIISCERELLIPVINS